MTMCVRMEMGTVFAWCVRAMNGETDGDARSRWRGQSIHTQRV
jgi:hypothetical protein